MKSNRMMGCATNAWFARFLFLLISLTLLMVLMPSAHAAELPEVCYPTSVQCSEDKTELKKIYDLTPEADPRGIARSDFERDGYAHALYLRPQPAGSTLVRYRRGSMMFSLLPKMFCSTSSPYL